MFLVSPFLFYQAMCLLAGVVYLSDGEAEVPVELPRLGTTEFDVPQPRGRPTVLAANEPHEQHVRPGAQLNRKNFGLSFGLKNGLRFHFDSETCLNY